MYTHYQMYYHATMIFLVEPPSGCPSYEQFVGFPIQIGGSCIGTCAIDTRVSYVCESSSVSIGYATCTADYTWSHSPPLETCTPAGEHNLHDLSRSLHTCRTV